MKYNFKVQNVLKKAAARFRNIYAAVILAVIFCFVVSCSWRDNEENKTGEISEPYTDNQQTEVTAPVFKGIRDFYVVLGNSVDYRQGIEAVGVDGENLTEEIVVDASEVTLDETGQYELVYSVEDWEGNKARESCTVYVAEGKDIQELVNRHQISQETVNIVGADNPYDGGVFEGDDIETVLEAMEPAFVRICFRDAENSSVGSGFIIEITESIFIFTNAHVVGSQEEVQVHFYDGRSVTGQVLSRKESPDMAVVKVDLENIPQSFRNTLRTVHIDEKYWGLLDENQEDMVGYRCLNTDGSFWCQETGRIISKDEVLWAVDYPVIKYTMANVSGASGSAVLDSNGNLIAMVLGFSTEEEDTDNWGIRLPDIMMYYKEVRGA